MALSSASASITDLSMLQNLSGARVAVIATEWNEGITGELKKGCVAVAATTNTSISYSLTVPGAFELPFAAKRLFEATQGKDTAPEAIVVLGAIIRGGTPHFDFVCKAVTEGITRLNLFLPIPVIFGVLTIDNEAQAWERLGGIHGHKGEEAFIAALKMIALNRSLS